MTREYEAYLAHYGVPGQKWGVRNWQNEDGTYTEAGKHHYGWGYGSNKIGITNSKPSSYTRAARTPQSNVRRGTSTRNRQVNAASARREAEAAQRRRERTRKILMIGAGVAVTAALGYAAYRGSTKLRDNLRSEVFKRFDTNPNNLHTLTSKYWDSADRKKYSELTAQRARDVSNNLTRRDAVAESFYRRTGIRINVPQSRERVLAQRRSESNYSNFIRDAEKRGHLNRTIHDARADLRNAEKRLRTYQNTPRMGTSKQYETMWNNRYEQGVDAARERLNNLLLQRRAG